MLKLYIEVNYLIDKNGIILKTYSHIQLVFATGEPKTQYYTVMFLQRSTHLI